MASSENPTILRVCESCHETGEGTGGLRNVHNVLFCARCSLFAEILTHIAYAAGEEGGEEAANYIVKIGKKAIHSVLPREDVVAIWADN